MKVRAGFVSNSSCSSFMIVGKLYSSMEGDLSTHGEIDEEFGSKGFSVLPADSDYSVSIIGIKLCYLEDGETSIRAIRGL